jgi:hypothetical protein
MITQPQYDRLPSYVKKELESLRRQRDVAVQQLREYEDSQTPSDIWTEKMICDSPGSPRTTKKYIQAYQVYMKVYDAHVLLRRDLEGRVILASDWRQLYILPRASNQVEVMIGR